MALIKSRFIMDAAKRRLCNLKSIINSPVKVHLRLCATKVDGEEVVTIGDVSVPRKLSKNPELIPADFVKGDLPQHQIRHLRWMAQKDILGQDIFLIGPPGPYRRRLAMQYLEFTNREVEYVSLSRDTTETDLKQRREISGGSAYYVDQCAVNAALLGRVLVVDGIEKAERNVLPVINNLLENREMQLEDGRFLMSSARYDKLLETHSKEELESWRVVRVSPDFRVIALGLPIPRYQGHPLDPPLRSRFQGRDISRPPFHEILDILRNSTSVSEDVLTRLLSFAYMFNSKESEALGLPDFPMDSVTNVIQLLDKFPEMDLTEIIRRIYPYELFANNNESLTAIGDALKKFDLVEKNVSGVNAAKSKDYKRYEISEIVLDNPPNLEATLSMNTNSILSSFVKTKIPAGAKRKFTDSREQFVATKSHKAVLSQMLQSHAVHDFCIVGPKGSGKSALVKEFARLLGYDIEPFVLYKDITARDLLQQRATLSNGDTIWRASPLVTAALEGKLLILDGIHRVDAGTLAVLHRLVHDRELQLFDGTRLLAASKYDQICKDHQLSVEEMNKRHILRIHESFRIAALAEPSDLDAGSKGTKKWLSPELLTLFFYHNLRPLKVDQEAQVLSQRGVSISAKINSILAVAHALRTSSDPSLRSLAGSLSTRQLLRIGRRLNDYPNDNVYDLVQNACLARFLPSLTKTSFEKVLEEIGIRNEDAQQQTGAISCEVRDGIVRIGQTSVNLYETSSPSKVPDILFYDIPQHLQAMESMLKDFLHGEHLLLIGNQGVGKNKIVDRFLQLLNRPRDYVQLHRDTTVQSLTLQPSVRDGVIVYEDSPLVRALTMGHVLVVDEADKAPAHVVFVLKTLLESGEMLLSDGRRVLLPDAARNIDNKGNHLVMHPDFRMVVLANRPGFPFLGNDFYGALGDVFACHPIDNPDFDSEISMLKQYGPNVPTSVLVKLTRAFGELRTMADSGLLAYPYSTREAVNIVKHLENFPNDSLSNVVRNVFDFDSYGKETVESLSKVLKKHGIPIGTVIPKVHLSKEFNLPAVTDSQTINFNEVDESFHIQPRAIHIQPPSFVSSQLFPLDKTDHRSSDFSELLCTWKLPMHYTNMVSDIKIKKHSSGLQMIVATCNPPQIYTFDSLNPVATCLELKEFIPMTNQNTFKSRVRLELIDNQDDILVFDEMHATQLLVNPYSGSVRKIDLSTTVIDTAQQLVRRIGKARENFHLCNLQLLPEHQVYVIYQQHQDTMDIIDLKSLTRLTLTLPLEIISVHSLAPSCYYIQASDDKYILHLLPSGAKLSKLVVENDVYADCFGSKSLNEQLAKDAVGEAVVGERVVSLVSQPNTYAGFMLGNITVDSEKIELRSIPKPQIYSEVNWNSFFRDKSSDRGNQPTIAVIPEEATFLRVVHPSAVPDEANTPKEEKHFLEVVDAINKSVRYMAIDNPVVVSPYAGWMTTRPATGAIICPCGDGTVAVADVGGNIHLYEIGSSTLQKSLGDWQRMIGGAEKRQMQVTIERSSNKVATNPKFGKIDPTNAPHFGGNTWAGGSGGRDTAGLGGAGGPFRLDSGNPVYQVTQVEKDAVPEEVRKAAREMARKAHQERLKEIQMSDFDAKEYEIYSNEIRQEVHMLRVILDSLQAKGKERQWLHHQTQGELDDIKMVEGITGEKNVFKRRGEQDPEPGSPQQLPKRLKLLVDVSGSMYRFNGYDGRMERTLESVLMMMQSLEGYEHKLKYEIIGHSGDDFDVSFVTEKKFPQNQKEQMDVLKMMMAHAQFCASGDNTLEATKHSITKITENKADEYFVIVMSDANFDRYGISPQQFAKLLTSEPRVNTYAIFIGSLGDQAHRLKEALPAGRAFVCLDTSEIPGALREIFTSSVLNVGAGDS
ncbi:von Willebrand factor A domain-containing protein 8 [Chamberlinius hualienensis]